MQPYCISAKLATQTPGQHIPTSKLQAWAFLFGLVLDQLMVCFVMAGARWFAQPHGVSSMLHHVLYMWPWETPRGVCCHTFLYVLPRLTPLRIAVRLAACVAAGAVHGWGCAFGSFCSAEGEA